MLACSFWFYLIGFKGKYNCILFGIGNKKTAKHLLRRFPVALLFYFRIANLVFICTDLSKEIFTNEYQQGINFSLSLFFLEKSNQKPWKLYVNVSSLRSVQGNFPQRQSRRGNRGRASTQTPFASPSCLLPLLLGSF